jgi:hypothetical protein
MVIPVNKYTTIIIGNGLGMAVKADYFPLEKGLQKAWSNLDNDTQSRIKTLLTAGDDLLTEQQLEKHYEVIQLCARLERFEDHNQLKWLDDKARDFPIKFRELIEDTAWHFLDYNGDQTQLNPLLEDLKFFINHNYTHIATLNYDKLIYGNFIDTEIMDGYNGELVDGFYSSGFHPHNLTRAFGRQFGWYLHLHGSPLFYTCTKTGAYKKTQLKDSKADRKTQGLREHIVLCNTNLKSSQISQSDVLLTYWYYFRAALDKSDTVIIFGCSGDDFHVNKEISDWFRNSNNHQNKKIKIIEYADSKFTQEQRQQFWSSALNLSNKYFSNKNLIRLPSILKYQFTQ